MRDTHFPGRVSDVADAPASILQSQLALPKDGNCREKAVPDIDFFELQTAEAPGEVLEADFPKLRGQLPISGGWGYRIEDACIIDRNDSTVNPALPFDRVGIQYVFAQHRIDEELIVIRPRGEWYSGIESKLANQRLTQRDGRHYDHLFFNVAAL